MNANPRKPVNTDVQKECHMQKATEMSTLLRSTKSPEEFLIAVDQMRRHLRAAGLEEEAIGVHDYEINQRLQDIRTAQAKRSLRLISHVPTIDESVNIRDQLLTFLDKACAPTDEMNYWRGRLDKRFTVKNKTDISS